jgi:hypothetical protein
LNVAEDEVSLYLLENKKVIVCVCVIDIVIMIYHELCLILIKKTWGVTIILNQPTVEE